MVATYVWPSGIRPTVGHSSWCSNYFRCSIACVYVTHNASILGTVCAGVSDGKKRALHYDIFSSESGLPTSPHSSYDLSLSQAVKF